MIASTAPASAGVKQPSGAQLPPLSFLQGGGQLNDYRFSGLTGSQAQFNGMTLAEVRQLLGNYSNQINQQFGPKKPSTVTGASSTDQALGYAGGIGAAVGGAYLADSVLGAGGAGAGTASVGTGAGVAGGTTGAGTSGSGGILSGIWGSGGGSGTAGATGSAGVGTATNGGTMLADGSIAGGVGPLGSALGLQPGTTLLGSTTLGAMGPALGVAAGAGVGALQGQGLYNAVRGRDMNFGQEAALALPTMGASFLVDPARKLFGSKREGERLARRAGRERFQDVGLMNTDSKSRYNLADGSQYDISTDPRGRAYEVDLDSLNDPINAERVGYTNALANALIGGKNPKDNRLRVQMGGELFNSYNSNNQFDANIRSAYDRVGGRNAVYEQVAERWKKGQLSADERDANFAAIDKLYGIKNESGAKWEDSANLSDKDKQRNAQEISAARNAQSSAPAQKPTQTANAQVPLQNANVDRNSGRPATPYVGLKKKGKK